MESFSWAAVGVVAQLARPGIGPSLGVDLGAVWLVVEQDLPALSAAVNRMSTAWVGATRGVPEHNGASDVASAFAAARH